MVRGLATSHRTMNFAMCWQHWFEMADITIVLANKINIPFSPHFERDWDFRAGARERCAWLTRVGGEDLTFLHSISGWCRHRWMGLIALHFGWRVQGGGLCHCPSLSAECDYTLTITETVTGCSDSSYCVTRRSWERCDHSLGSIPPLSLSGKWTKCLSSVFKLKLGFNQSSADRD